MSYFYLQESTTATAIELVDNFEHVGQGDCLPLDGSTLSATTGACDLGSSSYRWNNLFCQDIYIYDSITGDGNLWALESRVVLTATAASIEFAGLSGDTAEEYMIISQIVTDVTIGMCYLIFNQDTGTTFGGQYLHSFLVHDRSQNGIGVPFVYNFTLGAVSFSRMIVSSKSGTERTVIGTVYNDCSGKDIRWTNMRCAIWENTTDELTSFKFLDTAGILNFVAGTTISIWKRA